MRSLVTRFIFMLAFALACLGPYATAQSKPAAREGEFLGRFEVKITTGVVNNKSIGTLASAPQVETVIQVYRVGLRTDIYPEIGSITFSGDDAWIDNMSTIQLFDLIAHAAMSQAMALGKLECLPVCDPIFGTVRVIFPACVKRTGQGTDTKFGVCGPSNLCIREFVACCGSGSATPIFEPYTGGGSGGGSSSGDCAGGGDGCEPTCP